LLAAAVATFFETTFDGLFTFFFLGLLFLAEAFFDSAVAFLIIEFAEIVGFAFAQAGTLPGGGILFHVCRVCCFTTVVSREGRLKAGHKKGLGRSSVEAAASLPGAAGGGWILSGGNWGG
jgi:hypothetical protein